MKSLDYLNGSTGPFQVSMDITQRCNLKCVHCFNNSGDTADINDLSNEQKIDIAKQAAELHPANFCICGGEATCSPVLFEVIDVLKPGIGAKKVSMVSNGCLIDQAFADKLAKHKISLVQISIDGVNAWQHDSFRGVDGAFDRAISAVRHLKNAGITVNTAFTPNKLNFRSIEKYAQMCCGLSINEVRVMPFVPMGRGMTLGKRLMLDEGQYFRLQRALLFVRQKYAGTMTVTWEDPLKHMRVLSVDDRESINLHTFEIRANGDLSLCPYLPVTAGNAARHSLKEYWEAGYKDIWKRPEYTKYTDKIRNIYDFEDFEPAPYSGETIELDLIK